MYIHASMYPAMYKYIPTLVGKTRKERKEKRREPSNPSFIHADMPIHPNNHKQTSQNMTASNPTQPETQIQNLISS